jgi:hypothetical protein
MQAAFDRPRVVDIELDMPARKRRHRYWGKTLRRQKATLRPLRHDGNRLGRTDVAHDFQGRATVKNVNELVAGEMALPMIFPEALIAKRRPSR